MQWSVEQAEMKGTERKTWYTSAEREHEREALVYGFSSYYYIDALEAVT